VRLTPLKPGTIENYCPAIAVKDMLVFDIKVLFCFCLCVLRVGVTMRRGRPTVLEKRTNTSISLSQDDLDFIKTFGKENSAFIRELIAEKRKSVESPIGKIKQEIAERKKHVEDELLLIQMLETRLVEEEEKAKHEQEEKVAEEENKTKLKEFIVSRFSFIINHQSPNSFLEHLCGTYGLKDKQEARKCIFDTLLEAGHSEDRLKKIKMLKGI